MITKIAAFVLAASCVGLVFAGREHAPRWDHSDHKGTYVFEENGSLFGKVPWNAHVELELQQRGRYALRIETNVDGESESETSYGRYRTEGDKLVLFPNHGDETHELRLDGDKLQLEIDWPAKLALKAFGVEKTSLQREEK